MRERVIETLIDVVWGMVWAAMVVAVVLMSSGASDFIYIDF